MFHTDRTIGLYTLTQQYIPNVLELFGGCICTHAGPSIIQASTAGGGGGGGGGHIFQAGSLTQTSNNQEYPILQEGVPTLHIPRARVESHDSYERRITQGFLVVFGS